MKNLLNDAVRELVLRVNDEMIAIKEEIKVAENKFFIISFSFYFKYIFLFYEYINYC